MIEYKFCIKFKKCIWYVEKDFSQILEALEDFGLDEEMTKKWKYDVIIEEKMTNYEKVTQLIENYFKIVYEGIMADSLPCTDAS